MEEINEMMRDALVELKTAQVQFIPSDDAIIREHVENAIALLEAIRQRMVKGC